MAAPPDLGIYPGLLGSAWAGLPLVVRRLHREGRARGTVTIERGRSWPGRLAAQMLGFPPAGDNVVTVLSVERRGEDQVWSRRFGEHLMISRQRLRPDGLVAERFGSFECLFRLRPTQRGIDYDLTGVALSVGGLRVRLPRLLAPRGAARTWGEGDAMGLDVSIAAPLLGRILRYHGFVKPEGGEAPA
jgi:hypothetical protein